MTLYLIRHGKTRANEQNLYCGSTDLPLSKKGLAELQAAAECGRGAISMRERNTIFITSGMKRTNETLRALFGEVDYLEEPRLREMDFGLFEMRGYEELKNDPLYQAWISGDNHANRTPDGESGEMMLTRVLEALHELEALSDLVALRGFEDSSRWDALCESDTLRESEALSNLGVSPEKDLIIVTHGGVIAALMQHLFPREGKNRYEWQPACGHGYALENGAYRPFDPHEGTPLTK